MTKNWSKRIALQFGDLIETTKIVCLDCNKIRSTADSIILLLLNNQLDAQLFFLIY